MTNLCVDKVLTALSTLNSALSSSSRKTCNQSNAENKVFHRNSASSRTCSITRKESAHPEQGCSSHPPLDQKKHSKSRFGIQLPPLYTQRYLAVCSLFCCQIENSFLCALLKPNALAGFWVFFCVLFVCLFGFVCLGGGGGCGFFWCVWFLFVGFGFGFFFLSYEASLQASLM